MLLISWVYHQVFHCCRRVETILFSPNKAAHPLVPVSTLPWLWVGAVYDDGITVEYTNDINNTINYGLHVTTEWLNTVFDVSNVTWRYLDSKTLEEKDFHSSGFVIDDSESADAASENDSTDPLEDDSEQTNPF